jgi:hypothetical protein
VPSPKPNPVRVYLDSSDITNLSDPKKLAANQALQDTRTALIDLCQNGVAEFRFSYFHIIELAHLDAGHKDDALARAQFVKLLCGKNAYLHPSELRCFEALSLVQSGRPETKRASKARAYVEDARWLPESVVSVAKRFTEALQRGLNNRIVKQTLDALNDVGSNRKARRALKRRFTNRRGATAEAIRIAANNAQMFLQDWVQAYPLTKRFWDDKMLFQLLEKKISEEELQHECLAGFADPENFVGWCVDKIPSIREQPQAIRSTTPAAGFDELRREADERLQIAADILRELDLKPHDREHILKTLHKDLQDAITPDLVKWRRQELAELYQDKSAWFAKHHVKGKEFENKVIGSTFGDMPSADAFLSAVAAHFKKLGKLDKNHPKLTGSDLSDLLHCSFVPYTDIFSADKRTRDLVSAAAATYGTQIVVGTPALPDAIRSVARSRAGVA